jgi:hypothetical protein
MVIKRRVYDSFPHAGYVQREFDWPDNEGCPISPEVFMQYDFRFFNRGEYVKCRPKKDGWGNNIHPKNHGFVKHTSIKNGKQWVDIEFKRFDYGHWYASSTCVAIDHPGVVCDARCMLSQAEVEICKCKCRGSNHGTLVNVKPGILVGLDMKRRICNG